jgi:hypothetical protein
MLVLNFSVRQGRGQFPTPKASPEDEIFWIPSSLARHMGYSLMEQPAADRAVTVAETGAALRDLPPHRCASPRYVHISLHKITSNASAHRIEIC